MYCIFKKPSLLLVLSLTCTALLLHHFVCIPECFSVHPSSLLAKTGKTKQKTNIFIFATWRSGSSFFGEMFNQNPEVFYLYEPLWHIWNSLYKQDGALLQGAARDMLRSLYKCDFSVFQLYMKGKLSSRNLFRFEANKVICSLPLCPAHRRENLELVREEICKLLCPAQSLETLENMCKKHNTMVIKGIRLFDLEVLLPLMEDPDISLKVIHLVRDPRAVANSRLYSEEELRGANQQILERCITDPPPQHKAKDSSKTNSSRVTLEVMGVLCAHLKESLQKSHLAIKLGNYRVIRYEDLILEPSRKLRDIYSFARLSVTKEMERFVLSLSQVSVERGGPPFRVTPRNGTVVMSTWRRRLTFTEVWHVQRLCRPAMDFLGYKQVKNYSHLLDERDLLLDKQAIQT
ncbi:carbohydrate sulfotransferase 2-like [Protopterus annectens]|uniref:carbohydrate sulfotransferase 2-like n=1 Tax=Protopterus annectens TaxID=7888 RepID=UPI001CFA6F76|nr:carbohydrate sulfotransferase 2-like [Protopterus annectens]